MTRRQCQIVLGYSLAFATAAAALCLDDTFRPSTAQAVIGRPLTPMSYAGVARRTTRRAVYAGAVTGAAVATTAAIATTAAVAASAPIYAAPGPGCYQVVNSYGQIMYQCP